MSNIIPVEIEEGRLEIILGTAFAPVVSISELIKNSSDACVQHADVIHVYIDNFANTITIKDNGSGISMNDLDNLRRPGRSTKMVGKNNLTKIGEPYAGSKGLGILTAFNLCASLEISTYSLDDKRAYNLSWHRGTAKIEVSDIEANFIGTELVLHGVSNENIQLLIDDEELRKLFISTITYYINSDILPSIRFYLNGKDITVIPSRRIEDLYLMHKKPHAKWKGFFVAKAQFRYSKNKLYLSYEDNEKNLFTFNNEIIDLEDFESIKGFIHKYKIEFRHLKEIWEKFDKSPPLDDFEGCYYVWRDHRGDILDQYPYGVRVYVNNYGLYRYLNSDDDWLQHSEISQRIKNTNYKMRNTYGYVLFKNYNEDSSGLRISNDRNDFLVNSSQKKFIHIMRHFISGICSYIDIAMRNYSPDEVQLKPRHPKRNVVPGQKLNISDLIVSSIPLSQIAIAVDQDTVFDDDEGTIYSNTIGLHNVHFTYEDLQVCVCLDVKDPTPRFSLSRQTLPVREGTSVELSQYISQASIVGISISDIIISSEESKIKNKYFEPDNCPGEHLVNFSYKDAEYNIVNQLQITVTPLRLKESKKIKNLFPKYHLITNFKIKDVITDISECYTLHPTICMIGMRTLIEISLKAFQEEIYCEKVDNSANYSVEGKIKWLHDEISSESSKIDPNLVQEYKPKLTANYKKTITYFKSLNLNTYIHENDTIATPNEVHAAAKRFSQMINFIIEALLLKQGA